MSLDPTKVISGVFGKMYHDGEWLTNITQAQASGQITKDEIRVAGTRTVGHKVRDIVYSGTMTGYKITSNLARSIAQVADDRRGSFVTELVMKLEDPDNTDGKVWVRLKGVQFDTIPILNYDIGATVTEETPFTFSGFEYL